MPNITGTHDGHAFPTLSEARRACSRGYLLGIALSASIWVVLCVATAITVSSPLIDRLPNVAISQYPQENVTYVGSLSGSPFVVRFD